MKTKGVEKYILPRNVSCKQPIPFFVLIGECVVYAIFVKFLFCTMVKSQIRTKLTQRSLDLVLRLLKFSHLPLSNMLIKVLVSA